MKGDFSQWRFEPNDNFNGVLHQQGRVLLDQDWNASTAIERHLRGAIARDAFGANVAAVPAINPDGFKVTVAVSDASGVRVALAAGDVWADGVHLHLPNAYQVKAPYLAPPIQSPQASATTIDANARDAVILEVWDESFSAFQDPTRLIEPALGGVDTTARIQTAWGLRLLRLQAGDECGNLSGKLADNFAAKGKLSVTPAATVIVTGDCPVEMGGGYSGFEHFLYRVEIAEPQAGHARFKWSQFNGGLVGRGSFDSLTNKVTITANDQAINNCGLAAFYLEASKFDIDVGHWTIAFTAQATLAADGVLALTAKTGTWPAGADAFFRLWNGIAQIPTVSAPTELPEHNGLLLQFSVPLVDNSNYTPGDYWTFPVRAAGVPFDPATWPTNAQPQGTHYHRVPLGILDWNLPVGTITAAGGDIFDCRQIFQPLTKQRSCCSYKVGDGMQSFGDFDSIQAAINALPQAGGEICVLPGFYPENIVIESKTNIRLHGCGDGSVVQAVANNPAIKLSQVGNIEIEGLRLIANTTAPGLLIDDASISKQITLSNLTVTANVGSAIDVRAGVGITLRDSRIVMNEVPGIWPAVFFIAEDGLIQNNSIRVQAKGDTAIAGRGGLQLGGTCERVRVLDNLIQFGIGNGITLGTVALAGGPLLPWTADAPLLSTGAKPLSTGALYEIEIARNRILDMGLNGIGVIGFFDLSAQDEFISVVRINIEGNEIRNCLKQRVLAPIPGTMLNSMGYGGIALADVEYLVVRDNLIEGNGPTHIEPICGVFLLHGEGIDISRNRILHNGFKTAQPASSAKNGRRGGINIVFGAANTIPVTIGVNVFPRQDGVPAIKIHDNIVSQPLGQALALAALGPVSVIGNQFTSMGVTMTTSSPTFIAGCVAISNLGQSNEIYAQLLSFQGIKNGEIISGAIGPDVTDDNVLLARPGLDDQRRGQYLANGNVLFSGNQCVLDLVEKGLSLAFTSIFIMSLDEISFTNNQIDCNLLDDFLLIDVLLFGFSVRMNENRMKEGFLNAFYSGLSIGFMTTTIGNQSTHCIISGAFFKHLRVDGANSALIDHVTGTFCFNLSKAFGTAIGVLT